MKLKSELLGPGNILFIRTINAQLKCYLLRKDLPDYLMEKQSGPFLVAPPQDAAGSAHSTHSVYGTLDHFLSTPQKGKDTCLGDITSVSLCITESTYPLNIC